MSKMKSSFELFLQQALVLFLTCLVIGCSEELSNQESDWPLYGRDYSNQRYSPLKQINKTNIDQLNLAWKFNTGEKATFQTSPIVIDGIMYITTPFNDVVALNAETGNQLWRYQHQLRKDNFCCGPANRGPAVANGKVYTVTIDARLIALDQKTGDVIWDIEITDTDAGQGEILEPLLGVKELAGAVQTGQTGYSTNLAPQVYDGKIFVGITGALSTML